MKMKRAIFCVALIPCLLLTAHTAIAQQAGDDKQFEVGGQVTGIKLGHLDYTVTLPDRVIPITQFGLGYLGIGGRVGYNLNRFLSIEAEGNFFPKTNFSEVELSRKAQFFAGLKAGVRKESVGIFVKARPGIMYFSSIPSHRVCDISPVTGDFTCVEEKQTNFAFGLGGVVEYYPTPRAIIRFDLGDTIVLFKQLGPTQLANASIFTPADTTHSFQFSIGFGMRF